MLADGDGPLSVHLERAIASGVSLNDNSTLHPCVEMPRLKAAVEELTCVGELPAHFFCLANVNMRHVRL